MEKGMGLPGVSCEGGLCWREGTLTMTLTEWELLVMKTLNPIENGTIQCDRKS